MTKNATKIPFTGSAVTCGRVDDLLTESFELIIESGIVVDIKRVSSAPNLPANSIGAANRFLWNQIRNLTGLHKMVAKRDAKDALEA